MFKYLQSLQKIKINIEKLKKKLIEAENKTKSLIKKLFLIGLVLSVVSLGFQLIFHSSSTQQVSNQLSNQMDQVNTNEEIEPAYGQTAPNPLDLLNPFSSFQESIRDSISEILLQGIKLFDNFVAFTPNIAKSDGNIVDARGDLINIHINKFYDASQTIAWALMPLIIVLIGSYVLLEGNFRGLQIVMQVGKKLFILIIMLVSMRFLFSTAIDLTNALDRFVLQNLVGVTGTTTLSESLLASLGLTIVNNKLQFSIQDTLNTFGEIILWIGLFFMLLTLLFQFIIRFFHLFLHLILFPIALVIGVIPGGEQFLKSFIEEILRTLFVQPVFLIGIGMVLEITGSVDQPIPKVILGLGSLAFLNLIPSIINKFSGVLWGIAGSMAGGLIAASTINQAQKLKKGVVSGATGERSGSLRTFAGRVAGEALVSKLPFGNTAKSALNISSKANMLMDNQKTKGVFGKVLSGGAKGVEAFGKLGMKPLNAKSLEPKEDNMKLFSAIPDFTKINNTSLRDGEKLLSAFSFSNTDTFLGGYPLTENPVKLDQIADLSNFKAVNPQTNNLLNSVITPEETEVKLGKTFDSSNKDHWNHITNWYAQNEYLTCGKPIGKYQQYAENPVNKMNVIRRASSEGYFKAQGIKNVKIVDQVQGKDSVAKYYKVNPTRRNYARNRTTKTK